MSRAGSASTSEMLTQDQQCLPRNSDKSHLLCACIIGTRPEVIKMAPVIRCLKESAWARPVVIAVGQHTNLLDLAIEDFDICIDDRIEIMRARSSMMEVMAHAIDGLDTRLEAINPACVIAQGDTTTVLAAAIVAFHRRIPFVHVEAGLRTGDMNAPFPEEFNRRAVALATSLHCAPTARAKAALIAEGAHDAECIVTGNTVIDALIETAARMPQLPIGFPPAAKVILLTAHRRENFGGPLEGALAALRAVIDRYPDTAIFLPVHPNPNIKGMAERILGHHPRIVLSEPLSYSPLVAAMKASWLIVTDSGGLQEEGPALGKPVLVLREVTERPEALDTGVVRLVGTDPARIIQAISELHDDPQTYQRMARQVFPYGDGHAAKRIVDALRRRLMPAEHPAAQRARSEPAEQQCGGRSAIAQQP
jgi:UDP-N-acetylglucosamine 2-epimerase (non-hydrolysing)